jgi:hypothetical protein
MDGVRRRGRGTRGAADEPDAAEPPPPPTSAAKPRRAASARKTPRRAASEEPPQPLEVDDDGGAAPESSSGGGGGAAAAPTSPVPPLKLPAAKAAAAAAPVYDPAAYASALPTPAAPDWLDVWEHPWVPLALTLLCAFTRFYRLDKPPGERSGARGRACGFSRPTGTGDATHRRDYSLIRRRAEPLLPCLTTACRRRV